MVRPESGRRQGWRQRVLSLNENVMG